MAHVWKTFCTNKIFKRKKAYSTNSFMHICIFGTSADPPTGGGGHGGIVKHLSKLEKYNEIWVLPVYEHMYKSKRQRLSSFDHRMNMCQLAFEHDSSNKKVRVLDYEKRAFDYYSGNEKRIGTAELLEYLHEHYKTTHEFTLVLGSDSFLDLSSFKWRRSNEVFELVKGRILVIHRKLLQQNDNNLSATIKKLNEVHGYQISLEQIESLSDISSTRVRHSNDLEYLSNVLSKSVLEYIQKHKLYSFAS